MRYLLFAAALLSCALLFIAHSGSSYLTRPFRQAAATLSEFDSYREAAKQRSISLTADLKEHGLPRSLEPGTYVLVIGESQNREHLQAFGYSEADTTPWLSAVRQASGVAPALTPFPARLQSWVDNQAPTYTAEPSPDKDEFIFFDNAYSCHTHTVPVLTYALTAKDQYHPITLESAPSVIELLRYRYGFGTAWLSNQIKYGIWDTPVAAIGASAQLQRFTHTSGFGEPDGVLLPLVRKLGVQGQANFIVIHLMGSHFAYKDRYPSQFERFKNDENPLVGEYDNAQLYNDALMKEIYETVSQLPDFKALIYMADHADDVWSGMIHESDHFTWGMTRVPFYVALSPAYRRAHPERVAALRSHRNAPFTNDLLFDTLLGLIGATDNEHYAASGDLSSDSYAYTRSDLQTLHGRLPLSAETRPCSPDCAKIWLHRVDSPQKLTELGERFSGLELDLTYFPMLHAFENTHGNEAGKDEPTPVEHPLEATLKAYQQQNQHQWLWLDFKNLTEDNATQAAEDLRALFERYHIDKSRAIIESGNAAALAMLTKHGYKTSYYVPYYDFSRMTQEEINAAATEINTIAHSGQVSALSFCGIYYDFIKQLPLPEHFPLLTWFDWVSVPHFVYDEGALKILHDPDIQAILLKQYGHHHR